MKKIVLFGVAVFVAIALSSCRCFRCQKKDASKEVVKKVVNAEQATPKFLYKVVSVQDWKASKGKKFVKLSKMDEKFIHLARAGQLKKIATKFWGKVPKYFILKLNTTKLLGNMKFEANPGGTNKYYHLYNGSIPNNKEVIVDVKKVDKSAKK